MEFMGGMSHEYPQGRLLNAEKKKKTKQVKAEAKLR